MNVTLRQFKVFEAVARHLSFTRAATELFLTQPAVSMQIKQMESRLGTALFEQLGKRIFLTEAGREVCRYSRSIAQQLEELETVLANLKGVSGGRLKIAVASTANYFAPRIIAAFCRRFPGVAINLDVTNREILLERLNDNLVDVVIMGQPPEDMELTAALFMDNPLVVIAPPGHPLAKKRRIPLARLQQEVFLMRELGSGTRITMERFFTQRGIVFAKGMEMSSNEAIKQAVQAGLGLGLVSIHTLTLELETKRLVVLDVESFPILRHWYVVHRQSKRLSKAAEAFKEFVLTESQGLLNPPGRAKIKKRGRKQLNSKKSISVLSTGRRSLSHK